jgi:hypothetical protein
VNRYRFWLWKEWRDHRTVALGLLLALPVLTAAAGAVFRADLTGHAWDATSTLFIAVALCLYLVAVGAGLFAADDREGETSLAQRLPSGMPCALLAKWTLFFGGGLIFIAYELLLVAALLCVLGVPGFGLALVQFRDVADPQRFCSLCAEAFCFGSIVVMVGCWVRSPGASLAGGTVLWGLVVAALHLFEEAYPWFFGLNEPTVLVLSVVAATAAVGAASWAFLGGRRFVCGAWPAAWRSLAVFGVVALGGVAYARESLEDFLHLTTDEPDYRIRMAYLGVGERFVFLDVERAHQWPRTSPDHPGGRVREVRVVDLRDGTWSREGLPGTSLWRTQEWDRYTGLCWSRLDPLPYLKTVEDRLDGHSWVHWLDGSTGGEARRSYGSLMWRQRGGLGRELARDLSNVRDADDRRVWCYDGIIEREGSAVVHRVTDWLSGKIYISYPIPGGWLCRERGTENDLHYVDATSGATTGRRPTPIVPTFHLSPQHYLRRGLEDRAPYWLLGDVATGTERPPSGAETLRPLGVVARDLLLAVEPGSERDSLVLWDPLSGATDQLRLQGVLPQRIGRWNNVRGPDRHGRFLLWGFLGYPSRWWGLLDVDERELCVLGTDEVSDVGADPFATTDDGRVLVVEDERRIVSWGPEPDQRQVLFPRAEEGR